MSDFDHILGLNRTLIGISDMIALMYEAQTRGINKFTIFPEIHSKSIVGAFKC